MASDLQEVIARVRELDAKATPKPWKMVHRCVDNSGDPKPGHDEICGLGWDWDCENGNAPPEPMRGVYALGADAALVTEVRNHLTRLLDAAEAGAKARDAALVMLDALEVALPQAEGCFINHYGEDPWSVEASEPEYITKMRAAIEAADFLKGDSMTTAADLKPCPFCGMNAVALVASGDQYMVVCAPCQAYGPYCDTMPEAIAAWNRRAPLTLDEWEDSQ